MKIFQVTNEFVAAHFISGCRNTCIGWQLEDANNVLVEPSIELIEGMKLGVCEMLIGARKVGMLHTINGNHQLEIPSTSAFRGGIMDVQFDTKQKSARLLGYIGFGTFYENPRSILCLS